MATFLTCFYFIFVLAIEEPVNPEYIPGNYKHEASTTCEVGQALLSQHVIRMAVKASESKNEPVLTAKALCLNLLLWK